MQQSASFWGDSLFSQSRSVKVPCAQLELPITALGSGQLGHEHGPTTWVDQGTADGSSPAGLLFACPLPEGYLGQLASSFSGLPCPPLKEAAARTMPASACRAPGGEAHLRSPTVFTRSSPLWPLLTDTCTL